MNNNTPGIAMLRETFVFSTFQSQETFLVLLGRPTSFSQMKQIQSMICKLKTISIKKTRLQKKMNSFNTHFILEENTQIPSNGFVAKTL